MDFDQIDSDTIGQNTLEQEASEKENQATMMEYEAIRQEILGNRSGAKVVAGQAALARKEADAYVAASGFSEDRVYEVKRLVINSVIGMLETQYKQAEVRLGVRKGIGLGVDAEERLMAECEMIKDAVVERMLEPLDKKAHRVKLTTRTNAGEPNT